MLQRNLSSCISQGKVAAAAAASHTSAEEENIVAAPVGGGDLPVDSDLRQPEVETRLDEHRLAAERRHGAVHQRVALDEIEHVRAQLPRVVRALLQRRR